MKAAAVAAALLAAGCSVILMDKPPDTVEQAYPECDDSAAAPVVDGAITILGGLIVAESWDEVRDEDGLSDEEGRAVATVAGVALLHAVSSGMGFYWQAKCSEQRAEWERRNVRYPRPSSTRPTTGPIGPDRLPPRGGDGEPCYRNETCNDGFTCERARMVCVAAPR